MMTVVRNIKLMPNKYLALAGPSGVGKSTLVKELCKTFPEKFQYSLSHTTRLPRNNEYDGKDYYFITTDIFQQMITDNKFLEYAIYSGNYYGTSYEELNRIEATNRIVLLDIDIQGIQQIKKSPIAEATRFIFITPPDLDQLKSRLIKRQTETKDKIIKRLNAAKEEISKSQYIGFDAFIVNNDFNDAFENFKNTVTSWFPQVSYTNNDTQAIRNKTINKKLPNHNIKQGLVNTL